MPIKLYKSTRAARKKMSMVDRSDLSTGTRQKRLTHGKKRGSGRGSHGRLTIRHRGGGAKRLYRKIDVGQEKAGVAATVERLEYDPNRTAFVALMKYSDGDRRYVLAWDGAAVGDVISIGEDVAEKPGNRMPLKRVSPGMTVFNIEMKPGRGGVLQRAAGTAAIVMDVRDKHAQLKMPSGEVRLIPADSYATIGRASNVDAWLERTGSAGRVRRRGRRPQVRGKVMNPHDHPHGGGEGLQGIGMKHPKTRWGKPALGVKTRKKNKYSDRLILERRSKKKRK